MGSSLPGSSVHGNCQARILEWIAIFYSRGFDPYPDPGTEPAPESPALAGRFFKTAPPGKPQIDSFSYICLRRMLLMATIDKNNYISPSEWQCQNTPCSWSDQIRSVAQLCPTFCDPMNRSTPGLPVHHQFPEFTETHAHRVSDAIQPSHPLSSPSPPAHNLSQHQSLFQWVNSSHEVAKVLEFQL